MKHARAETITPPLDGFASGTLVLVGTTPLLMHSDRTMDPATKTATTRARAPEDEAERGTYRTRDGRLCLYARHILAAIVAAAELGGYRIHGRHSLAKVLKGALILTPAELALVGARDRVDIRNVVLHGNRVRRARRTIWPWKVSVTVHYYARAFERVFMGTVFPELVERAGITQGLLDYRPGRGGEFGRFKAQSWKLQ